VYHRLGTPRSPLGRRRGDAAGRRDLAERCQYRRFPAKTRVVRQGTQFRAWAEQGWITIEGQRVRLCDIDALRNLADLIGLLLPV